MTERRKLDPHTLRWAAKTLRRDARQIGQLGAGCFSAALEDAATLLSDKVKRLESTKKKAKRR